MHTEFEVRRHRWPHGGSVASVCNAHEAQVHTLKHTQSLYRDGLIQSIVLSCRRLHLINIKERRGKWTGRERNKSTHYNNDEKGKLEDRKMRGKGVWVGK